MLRLRQIKNITLSTIYHMWLQRILRKTTSELDSIDPKDYLCTTNLITSNTTHSRTECKRSTTKCLTLLLCHYSQRNMSLMRFWILKWIKSRVWEGFKIKKKAITRILLKKTQLLNQLQQIPPLIILLLQMKQLMSKRRNLKLISQTHLWQKNRFRTEVL